MLLSGEIKLRKTVNDQRGFIGDKYFAISTSSYAEEDLQLEPNTEKSYTPENGIMIYHEDLFTIAINGIDIVVNKFMGLNSNTTIVIKNTSETILSFTIYTF